MWGVPFIIVAVPRILFVSKRAAGEPLHAHRAGYDESRRRAAAGGCRHDGLAVALRLSAAAYRDHR